MPAVRVRILLTATQSGVLQDMRDTGVVWGVRLEADREDIVAVVTGNVQMLCSGLVVLQVQSSQFQLWDML